MFFADRMEGGQRLGSKLERYRGERPLVLGLTRGGVPVALAVARHLGAEMDVLVVRKIGAPFQEEYALGAVAEGGGLYVNADAARELEMGDAEVAALGEPELREVARRVMLYRGDRPPLGVAGRTVVVVDDGVATGSTARAACRAVRGRGAAKIVLAAPVVAAQSVPQLREDCDDVVAVLFTDELVAVGQWYRDFAQVSDDEVLAALDEGPSPGAQAPGELWNGEWINGEEAEDARAHPATTQEEVVIPLEHGQRLQGLLAVPPEAAGLVAFVHGSGSSRHSPRNQWVARVLQREGFATLLFDLLTPDEAREDERTARFRFDIGLLAARIAAVARWIAGTDPVRRLPLGLFGASTGAAAALEAAAALPGAIAAVVSRGGRPDLVPAATLREVRVPVLLLVGERDDEVLELNRRAGRLLRDAELVVVPRATHLFEEPGALSTVARTAAAWFVSHLAEALPSRAEA
jgi:putative phosphoribosyl transferase